MAVIANTATGERVTLGPHTLMGRGPDCLIRLDHPEVSSEHAALSYRDRRWWLRDLASTNGTYLRGERLAPGTRVELRVGSEIRLGEASGGGAWLVVDLARPVARACRVADARVREEDAGLLHLPEDEDPALVVFRSEAGHWLAETEHGVAPVQDQQVLQIRDEVWLLELPPSDATSSVPDTRPRGGPPRALTSAELRFRVSSDEEHVDLALDWPDGSVAVPARVSHYLLLTLARQRLEDRAQGVSENESGWLHVDDLAERLRMSRQKLNLDVSRARRQLAELGVIDPAQIVERRTGTGQIRVGVARLRVTSD